MQIKPSKEKFKFQIGLNEVCLMEWRLYILEYVYFIIACHCIFPQGYVVRISGGNDKQGFPMKQGVLTHGRVRLLLSKGHSCYRPRRTGERKRKSVRGCIVDANLSVLNLVIVKKGESCVLELFLLTLI